MSTDVWTLHIPGERYSEVWDTELGATFRRKILEDAGREVHVYKVALHTEDSLERTIWAGMWGVFKDMVSATGRIGMSTGYPTPRPKEENA